MKRKRYNAPHEICSGHFGVSGIRVFHQLGRAANVARSAVIIGCRIAGVPRNFHQIRVPVALKAGLLTVPDVSAPAGFGWLVFWYGKLLLHHCLNLRPGVAVDAFVARSYAAGIGSGGRGSLHDIRLVPKIDHARTGQCH